MSITAIATFPTISTPLVKTPSIGNAKAGSAFDSQRPGTSVQYLGIRWDGDKVRGIEVRYFDGASFKIGGIDDNQYALTSHTFGMGEMLKSMILRDSGYGYRSFRNIDMKTSTGSMSAGASGFDNEVSLPVENTFLAGVYGARNVDNFINSFGIYVTKEIDQVVGQNVKYSMTDLVLGQPSDAYLDTLTVPGSAAGGTSTLSKSVALSNSSNWSSTWGVKAGIKISWEAKVPLLGGSKMELSLESSYSYTNGGSATTTETTAWSSAVPNPPVGTTTKVSLFATQQTVDVPYSADITVKYKDGSTDTLKGFRGMLHHQASFDVRANISTSAAA
ncbi:MAG: aerolysin family beta-barrel pore-forming toxin [Terriglobia bacterium]